MKIPSGANFESFSSTPPRASLWRRFFLSAPSRTNTHAAYRRADRAAAQRRRCQRHAAVRVVEQRPHAPRRDGRRHHQSAAPVAGMLFFNDEGDEVGGLTSPAPTITAAAPTPASCSTSSSRIRRSASAIAKATASGRRGCRSGIDPTATAERSDQGTERRQRAAGRAGARRGGQGGPRQGAGRAAARVRRQEHRTSRRRCRWPTPKPRLVMTVDADGTASDRIPRCRRQDHAAHPKPMTLPGDAHIGQVSLTVRDLERSLPFYRDVLGFVSSHGQLQ